MLQTNNEYECLCSLMASCVYNTIPISWYKRITFESGKANHVAIICLSDIVYWYTPVKTILNNKQYILYRRFNTPYLRRSYDEIAELYGFTKRQVTEAMDCLEMAGLIERLFVNEDKQANILYIKLFPDKVMQLSKMEHYEWELIREQEISSKEALSNKMKALNKAVSNINVPPECVELANKHFDYSMPFWTVKVKKTDELMLKWGAIYDKILHKDMIPIAMVEKVLNHVFTKETKVALFWRVNILSPSSLRRGIKGSEQNKIDFINMQIDALEKTAQTGFGFNSPKPVIVPNYKPLSFQETFGEYSDDDDISET